MIDFQLHRNAFGRLVLTRESGEQFDGVVPVRAFPIAAPDEGLALVSHDGSELAWIDRLEELPAEMQTLLQEELANREFLPEVKRIRHVSVFATPSTWDVETDRGDANFVLKGEEDIRRIGQSTLIISDAHGVQYLVRDMQALDKASRKLLDRFL